MNSKHSIKKRIIDIDYEKNKISWIYYMPLLLISGFVPLIVHGKYVDLTGTTQALFWTGQNQLLDFFSYWKSRWVIFLTASTLIIYIFLYMSKKLPFKKEYKYYIPLGTYAFFVILSTIFATDIPTAFNGFVDMYQGMWVLLSYIIITFLVINFVNSERDIKLFLYAFIFLIIVEGVIGIGQYFGFDIFNTKFGNHLIIPSGATVDGELKFNFGKHTIYGTLFNTNFVGSFATLMLPMAVVFLISAKTVRRRIVAGVALALCVFTWIGCNSRAGYVGVFFSVLVSLIMLRRYIFNYWKVSVSVGILFIIGVLGFNYVSGGLLMNRLSSMNVLESIKNIKEQNSREDVFRFKSIDLGQDTVSIKTTHQDLNIKVEGDKLYFVDQNGGVLSMKTDENGRLMIDDAKKVYLKVQISENYSGFSVVTPWSIHGGLNFYITENGIKMIGSGNRIIEPVVANSFRVLEGLEKFASNRGYIWSRTIALLNEYMFIGSGPDNYPIVFPQDDYIAKLNIYMSALTVIDKPHNMYLQIAVNTGVISLIALIIAWLTYIFSSIKLYWKLKLDYTDKYIGISCFISVIGYLVSAIFNDHIVSVSPLFWVILGLGISINARIKRKEENNV